MTWDPLFWGIAALALLSGGAALWLALRAKAAPPPPKAKEPRPGEGGPVRRLWASLVYVFSSREERYRLPWTLILGGPGVGKSSLLTAAGLRPLEAGEDLSLPGARVEAFDQGLLIDPEAAVLAAEGEKAWAALLDQIDQLRPERPLDKLILAVSARDLLSAGDAALIARGRADLARLDSLARRFEFALPVYVVVTQCDAVPGFTEFWQALEADTEREILGWTAPPAFQEEASNWVEAAFSSLGARLRQLLLATAARQPRLDPARLDRFFLHPSGFLRLREPLARWFGEVFQARAWGRAHFCRGVYFTGALELAGGHGDGPRAQLDFLPGLLAGQILAETHLAQPLRRRVWSRNRLIRRLQGVAVAVLAGLFLALGWSGFLLHRQLADLDAAMHSLVQLRAPTDPDTCLDLAGFQDILTRVARLDARTRYLAMPLSWLDDRALGHGAEEISNASLEKVVMPAISCRLAKKARALLGEAPLAAAAADPLEAPRRAFLEQLQRVQALEENLERFRRASRFASEDQDEEALQLFAGLAAYAYDQPLPREVLAERGALAAALARIGFDVRMPLPDDLRQRYARRLETLGAGLRAALEQELAAGPERLQRLRQPGAAAVEDGARLVWWMDWVRKSWLASVAADNPCESIRAASRPALWELVRRHGYPESLISLADTFGEELCRQPALRTLEHLTLPPHGPLFTRAGNGLVLNPALAGEFSGLAALSGLSFMKPLPRAGFQCRADASGWDPALLGEAAKHARAYLEFASTRGLAGLPAAERPLYDRVARQRLEALLDDLLRTAQTPAPVEEASGGVERMSAAERRLARESADFAGAAPALLEVLDLQRRLGFAAAAERAARCARGQALDQLKRARTLADASRVYDPAADGGLAPAPALSDWLARQAARVQVIAGYASQYLAFLKNSGGLEAEAAFWGGTVAELERFLQFKESNGQVAHLHELFGKTLTGEEAGCRKRLAAPQAEYGDDLFSRLRRQRLEQARWECEERPNAAAFAAWRQLARRFNRELAGRYPFGPLEAADASPALAREFLRDYAASRESIGAAFEGLKPAQWAGARFFLERMDATVAFYRDTLLKEPAAGLRLALEFHARPGQSPGANQIVSWSLGNGVAAAAFPNRGAALDWTWDQPLELALTWASGSRWRPVADPARAQPTVDGAAARFRAEGPWALQRLLQRHRVGGDPLDPAYQLLAFDTPTQAGAERSTARAHLGLRLSPREGTAALRPPAPPQAAPGGDE